ncbi:cobalt-zinc-cadmium resistance protein [uncultured Azohydromonas sp.]|jgi:Protein of unknown function (DUF2946).|uniref:cobalt-zinc-cadmium resistance protein n=1 Tax=uncultured Azohydromonas sp. TaxID=487342 RepID=UPI002623EFA7|nr:cobalt-zinc-cadmium resistance protein [uncultured Azohydromonas sp.]
MRRFLLIVLMFVLPLQWSWAAAASLCGHEAAGAATRHFGHHQHEHHGAEAGHDAGKSAKAEGADKKAGLGSLGADADCGVCHGLGAAFLATVDAQAPPWIGTGAFPRYQAAVPDRSPDTLLRPPLPLVA